MQTFRSASSLSRTATRLLTAFAALFMLTTALSQAQTVTGTVRLASDSTALAGVKVYWLADDVRMDSTTTDANGEYTLEDVEGDFFIPIEAELDGYAVGTANAFFFQNPDLATVNFYLGTPGSLIGTVRRLSDNNPLADALVLLRQGNSDNSTILDSVRTGANGEYAFHELPPSNTGGFGGNNPYRVYASADGMVDASVTGIDLALSDTVVTDFHLGAAATISGTVRRSSDNAVLEGAEVTLRRGSATATVLETATTDAQGEYEFTGVAPGMPNYWISASDSGLATATNADVVVGSGADVVSDLSLDGILPGGIAGTVRTAADSSIVAGATIYLRRGSADSEILDSVVSGGNGEFSFDELEAGSPNYVLTVSAAALATITVNNVVVPNGDAAVANIYLPTLGGISGTIRKLTDSAAIADALVLLRRGNSDDSEILDSVRTDANGAYAFTDLEASSGGFGGGGTQYRVYASATGYAQASNTGIVVSNGATTTSDLYLGAPGSISGTILALPDSTPVAGALVELFIGVGFGRTFEDSVRTDSVGQYAFTGLTPGEDYQLDVSAEGYVSEDGTGVDVGSGADATADVVLSLAPVGSIHGTVIADGDSTVIVNALVVLRRSSATSDILDSVRTDSSGRFAFTNILAGAPNYWLTASAPEFESMTEGDIEVNEDDSLQIDFALVAVTSIRPGQAAMQALFTARRMGTGWLITMPAADRTRVFTMRDVRGVLIHRATVPAGATEITVPGMATRAGMLMRLE